MIDERLEDYINDYELPKNLNKEQKENNKRAWTTFWRRNPSLYSHLKLGVNLYPFQHTMIHTTHDSTTSFDVCTRGLTKTFVAAIVATNECMLKPNTTAIITAQTISQGTIMVKEKLEDELCKRFSPYLKYLYEREQIIFSYKQDGVTVEFLFNGSKILVLPPLDSSRGKRCQLLIYEECRLLKKVDIDSIFEGMKIPRRAGFLNNPKWSGKEELLEEPKSMYITSAGWKTEWFWNTFKQTFMDAFNDEENKNSIFAGDIYLAMKHGLKSKKQYLNYKKKMSQMRFEIEIMNCMIGEGESAYFTLEMFKKCSILTQPFMPPEIDDIISKNDLGNRAKETDEIRLLAIDFATKDTHGKTENDMSVIICMSGRLNEKGDKLIVDIEHIERYSGSKTALMALRIRELYYDYEVNYIVSDFLGGGEMVFRDVLSAPFYHDERGVQMNGFTICNEMDLQVRPESDLNDFRKYTIDPNAIPCIIPFKGNVSTNSEYHMALKDSLREEKLRFLIDEMELDGIMSKNKEFILSSSTDNVKRKIAHIQTSILINEAINLEAKYKDGKVVLEEPRSGTKDSYMAMTYGNFIMRLLENKLARVNFEQEFDIEDWSFLMGG